MAPSTLFSSSSNGWFTARPGNRTDAPATTCAAPPADTRRVPPRSLSGPRRISACTFYLVFKEPELPSPSPLNRRQGNLPILLTQAGFVNPLLVFVSSSRRRPFRHVAPTWGQSPQRVFQRGVGRAEKACSRRCPADRAEPTQYTIATPGCQPRANRVSFVGRKGSIGIPRAAIKHDGSVEPPRSRRLSWNGVV
jgi:hypothetical protein